MNEPAPKSSGLQIAIILATMLATILAVTAYKLYRENLELKQQLQQRNAQARADNHPHSKARSATLRRPLAKSEAFPFGLPQRAI